MWPLEEEEEADEGEVFANSWGDTQALAGRLGCRCGQWEIGGCKLGWLGVIDMDHTPSLSILIYHLIWVGDPFYPKGAFPPRS